MTTRSSVSSCPRRSSSRSPRPNRGFRVTVCQALESQRPSRPVSSSRCRCSSVRVRWSRSTPVRVTTSPERRVSELGAQRHHARERALEILYEATIKDRPVGVIVSELTLAPDPYTVTRSEEHTSELQSRQYL